MGSISEQPEKGKVVEMGKPSEEEILAQAAQIQAKREAEQQAQEAAAYAELESSFGLTKESIDAAVEVEKWISDSNNGVTTLVQAMGIFKQKELTYEQVLFLAINSNSRANMFRGEVDRLAQMVHEARAQVASLSQGLDQKQFKEPGVTVED